MKVLVWYVAMSLFMLVIVSQVVGGQLTKEQAGSLGDILGEADTSANVLDKIYKMCNNKNTKFRNEVDRIVESKINMKMSAFRKKVEEKKGVTLDSVADSLVEMAIEKTGGCETENMNKLIKTLGDSHKESVARLKKVLSGNN